MSNLKYKHTAYTSAQWASLNPVIVENEIVIESDTKRTKIGNGISTYNELEYADTNSVGNSLGSIKPTDAAPTPARNGNYTFSIGGNKPAWLTAEAGVTKVKAGDGVAVVYTAPSSYVYTHVDMSSDFITIQKSNQRQYTDSILLNGFIKEIFIIGANYPTDSYYIKNVKRNITHNGIQVWTIRLYKLSDNSEVAYIVAENLDESSDTISLVSKGTSGVTATMIVDWSVITLDNNMNEIGNLNKNAYSIRFNPLIKTINDFVKKETGKGLISTTKEGNIPANTNDEILDINKSINGFERYLIDGIYWGIQPGFTTVESYVAGTLSSLVVKCKKGDQFYIKTQGRNVGHPYYVVSQLGGVAPIVDSGLNNIAAIYEITISDINARYLIVNTDIAYKSNVIIRKNKDIQIANKTSTLETKVAILENVVQEKTIICCWGSSSVEGYLGNKDKFVSNASGTLDINNASGIKMSFPRMLASLVNPDKYEVWNCGIGGEGVPTVLSRMGAIPCFNDTEFILPANGDWVDCARYDNNTFLKSLYDDSIVVPSDGYISAESYDAQSVLNPVIINGIECTLDLYSPSDSSIINNSGSSVFLNGAFRIKRNIAGISNLTIKAGTLITPYAAKLFKNRKVIHVYLIGANGGWYNLNDWKLKLQKSMDWLEHEYLICGYHNNSVFNSYSANQISQFSIDIPTADNFRAYQKKEYGLKFLDLRNKISKWWFVDFASEMGLKIHYVSANGAGTFNGNTYTADDVSVIPTEYHDLLEEMPVAWKNLNLPTDIQCYNLEVPPTTLMADPNSQTNSGQHCNYDGYRIMGKYIYNKLIEIGFIKQ